jgi:hypothetical protein
VVDGSKHFRPSSIKGLGVLDLLGALGLILPATLDIASILVPLAATGLVLLMAGAVITRVHDHIPKALVFDLTSCAGRLRDLKSFRSPVLYRRDRLDSGRS